MNSKLRAICLYLISLKALAGCSADSSTPMAKEDSNIPVGGLYATHSDDGSWRILKVLAVDNNIVHLRSYANRFLEQPKDVDPALLTLGGINDPAGFGIGHLPLAREGFFRDKPVFMKVVPVKEDELDGYKLYLDAMKGGAAQVPASSPSKQDPARPPARQAVPSSSERAMPTTFDSLYAEFAINSFDKQLRLADVHGKDNWGFSLTKGEITFNKRVAYKMQLLGTEDLDSETWMWAWANKESDLPEGLLNVVNELRAYGEKHKISQLTTRVLPLDTMNGHTVGMIAGGFANGTAYYRCPHKTGAVFVLIVDPALELTVPYKVVRATRVIPESLSALEIVDHRQAINAYLRQNGFNVVEEGGKLLVKEGGPPIMTVEFDNMNRFAQLTSHAKPKED